ncbi:MAG: hypothetical protein ABI896_10275 [Actinomycetota bacterium]
MPSRKQRRRREKDRRHEYEYVYVDEEGQEVEVAEAAAESKKNGNKRSAGDKRPAQRARGGRKVEPASWNRVGRRALIFAPLMFITIRLLEKNEALSASVLRTVFLLALFLPFSYVMDSMLYRAHLKRTGASPPDAKKR